MDAGLLLLRVTVGLTLAAHGSQKLFGWFNGPGTAGFAEMLTSMGFRRGRPFAWAAGLAEFVGGLCLALGLLTPLAAAAIVGMMFAAAIIAHWDNGFFVANGGFEYPFVLAVAATAIALAGPGAFALDTALGLQLEGPAWAGIAVALGALGAVVVVTAQRAGGRTAGEPQRA